MRAYRYIYREREGAREGETERAKSSTGLCNLRENRAISDGLLNTNSTYFW